MILDELEYNLKEKVICFTSNVKWEKILYSIFFCFAMFPWHTTGLWNNQSTSIVRFQFLLLPTFCTCMSKYMKNNSDQSFVSHFFYGLHVGQSMMIK